MSKTSVFSSLIYRFNTISNKIPAGYFVDINILILKIIENKRPSVVNTKLKMNKVGVLTLPDFKTCYRLQYLRHSGMSERTETPINRPE